MSGPKGIDFYYGDGTPSLAGQTFDVIKAAEGDSFPPDGPIPDWYASEQAKIRATGALFGAYLFWHPSIDNAAQLANFQKRANLQPGDVVQLDCEVTDGLDWATVNARKNDMLNRLKAAYAQCRVMLYTYLDFWNHLDGNAADGLWIADPNSPPGQPKVQNWLIHQYASSGVDYDIANFPDAAALRTWATALDSGPADPQPARRNDMHVNLKPNTPEVFTNPAAVLGGTSHLLLASDFGDATVRIATFNLKTGWNVLPLATIGRTAGAYKLELPPEVNKVNVEMTGGNGAVGLDVLA